MTRMKGDGDTLIGLALIVVGFGLIYVPGGMVFGYLPASKLGALDPTTLSTFSIFGICVGIPFMLLGAHLFTRR